MRLVPSWLLNLLGISPGKTDDSCLEFRIHDWDARSFSSVNCVPFAKLSNGVLPHRVAENHDCSCQAVHAHVNSDNDSYMAC